MSKLDFNKVQGEGSICVGRSYYVRFFKGCLPQIFLGPFLNILILIILSVY